MAGLREGSISEEMFRSGHECPFETVSHGLTHKGSQGRGFTTEPIIVKDEVWIGSSAVILQGVTIGRGAVVAAGAVVNRDMPPRTLVGGVPARVLRSLDPDSETDRAG